VKQLYHSYDQALEIFHDLARRRPDLFRVEAIGETWEKREIVVVTITDGIERAEEKPALFYTGTIHAREWIGIELAIAFVVAMGASHPSPPEIRDQVGHPTDHKE